MKKKLSLIVFLMFLGAFLNFSETMAQGAACVPDMSYASNAPGLYPDSLPVATGCQFYDVDVTFKLPRDTVVSPIGTVNFLSFEIDTITGFPPGGMQWQSNKYPTNFYDVNPNNPNPDTLGCVRIWGTPVQLNVPDTFKLVIRVIATVDITSQPQITTFVRDLIVTPCVFQGACYSYTQSQVCEPAQFVFQPSAALQNNGQPGFTYSWTFGNGQTSTQQFPTAQNFPAGTYYPKLDMTIDTLGYFIDNITINTVDCTESIFGTGAPDVYWILKDGAGNTIIPASAPLADVTVPPAIVTNISGVPVNLNSTYNFEVWDDDANDIPSSTDDGCANDGNDATVSFMITGAGTFTAINQGLSITYTVVHPIGSLSCQDTIQVSPLPPKPGIITSADTAKICEGDIVPLFANTQSNFQWFLDGDTIPNATGPIYNATVSGTYTVQAINNDLCFQLSDPFVLNFNPKPSVTVSPVNNGNSITWTAAVTPPGVAYYYQWKNLLTGNVVGVTNPFTASSYGNYQVNVLYQSIPQCSTTINLGYFVPTAITGGFNLTEVRIYPNPTSGDLNVNMFSPDNQDILLSVKDLLGREILSKKLTGVYGEINEHFSLSGLPRGVYLFNIETPSGSRNEKIMFE
ncbi:MAG: T9SS type A sorting domain-containing protein [Bacteroidia bacterium]|nr:T9SS type A sorting domain-containing protein [Bacteroidia bacterium]